MKNLIIKELVEFMIKELETCENEWHSDAKSFLDDKKFGRFKISTRNLKIDKNSMNLGDVSIYGSESNGYSWDKLFQIDIEQKFYYFWTNEQVKEDRKLINRLYHAILKFSEEQSVRIDKAKYKKYFDMLPDEKKQNIMREEKLKRITKENN